MSRRIRSARRNVLVLSLVLAAGLGVLAVAVVHSAQAVPPGKAVAGSGRAANLDRGSETGPGTGPKTGPGAGPDLGRIWWNQPRYVAALGLTDQQRSAMDALMRDRLVARRSQAQEYTELRTKLGDQLAAGEWKEAEATAAAIGDPVGAMVRGEAELTMAVTRLLDASQRRTLAADYPAILHRPWLRGGAGGRSATGAPRGRRQNRP